MTSSFFESRCCESKRRLAVISLLATLLGCLQLPVQADPPAPQYVVIDLGTLGSGTFATSNSYSINKLGQVVGNSTMADGRSRGFFYSGGVMQDLGALSDGISSGVFSSAYGMNDRGDVVGEADTPNNVSHAFLYTGGKMKDLGTLGGATSAAEDINNAGVIVGQADLILRPGQLGSDRQAFIYKAGKMSNLGTLGGQFSHADSINDAGVVAGSSTTRPNDGTPTAFVYPGRGTIKSLGTLGGDTSYANYIDAKGIIVGSSDETTGGASFAFSYFNGAMSKLFGGQSFSASVAVCRNATGTLVGKYQPTPGSDHAFVATSAAALADINTLIDPSGGYTVTAAIAINDSGMIAGNGLVPGATFPHALLLVPAGTKPISLTGGFSGVTTTAATINGAVNANGSAGMAWLEYGTTRAYGTKTPMQAISGSTAAPLMATLANLKPHTTYFYRVVGKNGIGTTNGGDASFKTLNTSPVAHDDIIYVASTRAVAGNVLANDTDGDKDKLINPYPMLAGTDGNFTRSGASLLYKPGASFTGLDDVRYFVTDGFGGVSSATAYVMNPNFDGLLMQNAAVVGKAIVTMSAGNKFTSTFQVGTATYKIRGALDGNYHADASLTLPDKSTVTLSLDLDRTTATITGHVTDTAESTFTLVNDHTVEKDLANKKYTVLLDPPSDPALPQGTGYATMTISAAGAVKVAGRMGDGTTLSAGANLHADGMCNLCPLLTYGKLKGYAVGGVSFTAQNDSDALAQLRWVKPATLTTYEPAAFDTTITFQAAVYTPPVNATVLTFGATPQVIVSEGGLVTAIPHGIAVSTRNIVTVTDPGTDRLAVKLTATTGLLTGSFIHPTTKRATPIYGAIYQKKNLGARGLFVGPTVAGAVTLNP